MQTRIRALTLPLLAATLLFLLTGMLGAQQQQAAEGAAQSWTGKLVDADCKAGQPQGACEVSMATKSFGVVTGRGVLLKLDQKGNDMAKEQIQAAKKEGSVQVTVKGRMEGDTIQVEAIQIG